MFSLSSTATALPLENGDHLEADEFLRRYEVTAEHVKAELVNGIVYMASPVNLEDHGEQDNLVQTWLGTYAANTPGVRAGANSTTKLGPNDVPQPDALLIISAECGGQTRVEKILHGAPELVFEVAASSASLDNHAKRDSYECSGVREYLLWQTLKGELCWWKSVDGNFVEMEPDEDGLIRSEVFPGLWLDWEALLKMDGAAVLEALSRGLASDDHADFVKELAEAKK